MFEYQNVLQQPFWNSFRMSFLVLTMLTTPFSVVKPFSIDYFISYAGVLNYSVQCATLRQKLWSKASKYTLFPV